MTSRRASDFIGGRIREIRMSRGWTAKDLAARCADIGAPEITAAVIANIETGRRDQEGRRRREVTVDEVLALAFALELPPVLLFLPLDGTDKLQISPSVEMDVTSATAWVEGDDDTLRYFGGVEPPMSDEERRQSLWRLAEARPLTALRRAWMWVHMLQHLEEEGAVGTVPAGMTEEDAKRGWDEMFALAVRAVARDVDIVTGKGLAPPPLPRKIVDALREGSLLEYPLEYPGELLVSDEEA